MHSVPSDLLDDSPPSFEVVRVSGSRASLRAAGELDLAAVEGLSSILAAQLAAGRRFIRLDLSAVTFIDCSCLGVLVAAHHRLRGTRGQLLLTDVSGPVVRLLDLTGMAAVLLTTSTPATVLAGVPA